jgi:hypothetical protein
VVWLDPEFLAWPALVMVLPALISVWALRKRRWFWLAYTVPFGFCGAAAVLFDLVACDSGSSCNEPEAVTALF